MTKKQLIFKTLAICAILLAGIIFPTILTAQRSDGFFKSGDEGLYENRDEYIFNDNDLTLGGLTGENPTTVPLGGGLLVLSIAGAGYTVARHKRSRRYTPRVYTVGMVLMALTLMFGMTQCKKREMIAEASQKIFITVDVDCNAAKTGFIPGANGDGSFVWTPGKTEYIEVGHSRNGVSHVGYLEGQGDGSDKITFRGTLTMSGGVRQNDIFYFFYLGSIDKRRSGCGDDWETTLHITDQYGTMSDVTKYHWAIGSYKCGPQDINQQNFHIEATLEPAMSILYVVLSDFGDETIRMYGDDVYTVATIDYAHGTIVGKAKGSINLGIQGEKYIALIPSSAPSTTVKFASNTKYAEMNFNCGIKAGKFYSDSGNALAVQGQTAAEPAGVLSGLFSVASGKQVKFSQGNLQYRASTDTWRFAENQYDYVGSANTNVSSTYSGWIDLFGWGTSGYHDNNDIYNIRYYPYSIGTGPVDSQVVGNVNGYGPTNAGSSSVYTMPYLNFVGESIDYDWGMHNAISNGGNAPGKWRTLSNTEWKYLFNTRNTGVTINGKSNARYAFATISISGASYNGIIIIPDSFSGSDVIDGVTWGPINTGVNNGTWGTICTSEGWNELENRGCVFLPASGKRTGPGIIEYVGEMADYWSNKQSGTLTDAKAVFLGNQLGQTNYGLSPDYGLTRSVGASVRLVRDN